MDFGKILDEWDRQRSRKPPDAKAGETSKNRVAAGGPKAENPKAGSSKAGSPESVRAGLAPEPDGREYLRRWLLRNGVPGPEERETVADDERKAETGASAAERIKRMRPQAVLDLHGKTLAEAESAIDSFLADTQRQGLEKVLIIHGKGLHSESEPVLASRVQRILEGSPLVGAFGPAEKNSGGRGATWARIRKADYFSR
ncbi:MAG: Smr/MutS family protein [Spirochaetia bacterium]|jgi:hypothetical protein|nr:Smr/MutS family protein [Spirochaetia bacterium]